jgi:hypothetical protein
LPAHITLSDPPTPQERLQLAAATLQGVPVLIIDDECLTAKEWEARYCTPNSQADHVHPRPTERS